MPATAAPVTPVASGRHRAAAGRPASLITAVLAITGTLVALQQTIRQERLQMDVVAASRQAFDVSETQLHGGTVNLITVLQTEQTLFTAEDTLAQVRLTKFMAVSSLFQALGGGWNPVRTVAVNQGCVMQGTSDASCQSRRR